MFPGVTAVPSLGHTPGHTAYLIASGDDQLMIWGDTVHVPEVQTAFPEAGMAFDTDLAAAAAARKRMFDRVSADGILIAGMHLHFPAFSRLARRGDAYALYPGGLGSRAVGSQSNFQAILGWTSHLRNNPPTALPTPFPTPRTAPPIAPIGPPTPRE